MSFSCKKFWFPNVSLGSPKYYKFTSWRKRNGWNQCNFVVYAFKSILIKLQSQGMCFKHGFMCFYIIVCCFLSHVNVFPVYLLHYVFFHVWNKCITVWNYKRSKLWIPFAESRLTSYIWPFFSLFLHWWIHHCGNVYLLASICKEKALNTNLFNVIMALISSWLCYVRIGLYVTDYNL